MAIRSGGVGPGYPNRVTKRATPEIQDVVSWLNGNSVAAVIFDFDGVFTDNRVLTFQDGTEAVSCSRSDGMGIELLRGEGLPMVVISKERNPVTSARCAKLGLEVIQGIDDKESELRLWLDGRGIAADQAIYVGNDVNDLACMALVGCAVAVADAHGDVLAAADIVLPLRGGYGAVRFLADAILHRLGDADLPVVPKGQL